MLFRYYRQLTFPEYQKIHLPSIFMGSVWLRIFLGIPVSEKEFNWIEHPRVEMAIHVTFKMLHAGTICGTLITGPLLALSRGRTKLHSVAKYAYHWGKVGALVGLSVGPIYTAFKIRNLETEELSYMCWKLRRSRYQLRVDRLSLCGLAGGGLLGTVVLNSGGPSSIFGLCGGVIAAECLSMVLPRKERLGDAKTHTEQIHSGL